MQVLKALLILLGVQKCSLFVIQVKQVNVDVDAVTDFLTERFSKASLALAIKNMGIIRYGFDAVHRESNIILECIRRLENNGVLTYADLLESYTKSPRKNIVNYMKRGPTVPKTTREAFFLKFLHDGLKSQKDKEFKKTDIKGVDIPV